MYKICHKFLQNRVNVLGTSFITCPVYDKTQMNFGADFGSDNFLFIVTNAQATFFIDK